MEDVTSYSVPPGTALRFHNGTGIPLKVTVETPNKTKVEVDLGLGAKVTVTSEIENINIRLNNPDNDFTGLQVVKE